MSDKPYNGMTAGLFDGEPLRFVVSGSDRLGPMMRELASAVRCETYREMLLDNACRIVSEQFGVPVSQEMREYISGQAQFTNACATSAIRRDDTGNGYKRGDWDRAVASFAKIAAEALVAKYGTPEGPEGAGE